MRHRSSGSASSTRSSESGHIVVIDEHQCFATTQSQSTGDSSKEKKRHPPLVRFTGKLVRLVLVGFFLHGAYLVHNSGFRNRLSVAVRILSEPQEEPTASEKSDAVSQETPVDKINENKETSSAVTPAADAPEKTESLKVPNVLVVGAQRSGTAAVASWLFHHKNVCKPHSVPDDKPIKEVRFFDSSKFESRKSPEEYAKHFTHCNGNKSMTHVVDATSDYFQHADRVHEMYDKLGEATAKHLKVVVVAREPVDREFAWYHDMLAESKKPNAPKYTRSVMNKKGQLISFDRYTERSILPKVGSSHAGYAKFLREWINQFDRQQLLVLSYDELATDPTTAMGRVESFLKLEEDKNAATPKVESINKFRPSCAAQSKLAQAFEESTNDLYKLLDAYEGPEAEQRPFPRFELTACKPTKKQAEAESVSKGDAQPKKVQKHAKSAPKKAAPTTVFFATHHKTGTDISRSVAALLRDKGLAKYSEDYLDERDLMKNAKGEDMTCSGSADNPEIRSYNQWPKWIIDNLWGKCVGKWWDSWPSADTTTNDLFDKCIMGQMDSLKEQLKTASCGTDYLVVHFVRNPVDLMLSSYRYTKLGREEWMHDNIVGHPRFVGEYCGNHNCFDMTIQEAIRDLPPEIGLQLDMHLVSMETVKQMMVGSVLARGDPEHHITVSLSDIMESSESFNKTWNTILSGVYPNRKPQAIQKLVTMLKMFDMNADPENFAGNSHSTVGKTSQKETEKHKKSLTSDAGVKHMMNDPLIKTLM